MSSYDELYEESIQSPKSFWSRMAAKTLQWEEPFTEKSMENCDVTSEKIHWFDGKINASGK